ncbi:MAG: hypothetical protein HZB79_08610 [Deltaproteobacteria bacterium]|nr:hypothetical protein [Deltaproteobacteria bacterium]
MNTQSLKTIGASGQISLGKEYAGRPVIVEEIEEGVWFIKTAKIIPDSEMWMHEEPAKSKIDKAVKWAEKNKPAETNLEKLSGKIR